MMKFGSFALVLAAALPLAAVAAPAPAPAQDPYAPFGRDPSDPVSSFAMRDKAGNEQQHLVRPAPSPGRIEGERCMPRTQLCFSLNETDDLGRPLLRVRQFSVGAGDRALPLDLEVPENGKIDLWSLAIRRVPHEEIESLGEPMIVGVRVTERLGYAGGAAYRDVLWLYRIDNAGTDRAVAEEVLSVPIEAEQSIGACFNRRDERARHNACLDLTSVEATLVLDSDNTGPMPRLVYRVATSSYPSDMPLRAPEDLPKQLTAKDLVTYHHPTCSYERRLAWNPATARYEFDRPAPDCRIFGLQR